MSHREKTEYDWLNDPFDEKKAAEELERARGMKGAGCMLAFAVLAALGFIAFALFAMIAAAA